VVAAPTESSYGLLADCARTSALDALFALKPREKARGVPVLVPNWDAWASLVVEIPPSAARLARRFWPGPLTIALPARDAVDPRLSERGTLAVRMPGPSLAAELVAAFRRPVTATSANRPAESAALTATAVRSEFASEAERGKLYVLDGVGEPTSPSTLVSIDANGSALVVREGAISRATIEAAIAAGQA
jgi:L-threonylcarbamoyladenylate synthase